MKWLTKMKLAAQIAVVISAVVVVIFGIILGFTIISTGTVISTTVMAEFNAIAKGNAQQIKQIFDAAETTTADINAYLNKAYVLASESGAVVYDPHYSSVYGQEITELSSDVEKYITETARNAAVNNQDIVAMGVFFEPYKFDKNIKDYAFYVTEDDVDAVIVPYGDYEEYSKEIHYVQAAEAKKTIFTKPYDYNGIKVVTVATPILYNNELQGVILADINVTNFAKVNSKSERYPSMYTTIYDNNNIIVYDSDDIANVGTNMGDFYASKDELALVQNSFTKGEAFEIETSREDGTKYMRFFYPIDVGGVHWWTLNALETNDMNKSVNQTTLWVLGMSLIGLAAIVAIVILVIRKILKPLNGVVQAAEDIAAGNLDIHLEAKTEDEIGILTKTFDHTAEVLKCVIGDITHVLDNIADKNLDIDTSVEYVGDLKQIEASMASIVNNLNEVMASINESADQVASGSDQIAIGAQALAQGATEQASSIQELSATIMEISGQIDANAKTAQTADQASDKATREIEASNQQMTEMIEAIGQISSKSNEIGKIIKTIEDIAFQTNILALNAAVEAARAGVAGKGFAVVADEVRNLASKSAEAAKNTTTLIQETIFAVENGTKIADKTANSLQSVVTDTKDVADLMARIAAASSEQALAIAQVNLGVEQIASVIQTNSATAEESAAAAEELSSQAQMLKDTVGEFYLR